jgi:hypothetical protein
VCVYVELAFPPMARLRVRDRKRRRRWKEVLETCRSNSEYKSSTIPLHNICYFLNNIIPIFCYFMHEQDFRTLAISSQEELRENVFSLGECVYAGEKVFSFEIRMKLVCCGGCA